MSTPATGLSDAPLSLRALGYLDLAALVLALPLFLVAGFSMLGYAVAAAAWVIQRLVRDFVLRKAATAPDVRTSIGLTAASMIIRGWLVAFAIFAVGLRDPEAGLAAAVLFLFLFSIFFTMQAILRPTAAPPGAGGGTGATEGSSTGGPSGRPPAPPSTPPAPNAPRPKP